MKKQWNILLFSSFAIGLAGCGSFTDYKGKVSVSLYSADHVSIESQTQYVNRGENAQFSLEIETGYSLTDTSYTDYSLIEKGNNHFSLILEKVEAPVNVSLVISKNDSTITYHANGGSVQNGSEYFTQSYNLTNHKRANTDHGIGRMEREGYTLLGWNTKADRTGEAIGLGSRVSIPENGLLDLYASWAEWSPAADFTYALLDGNITIQAYDGNDDTVVIPEKIEGRNVVSVAENAFKNVKASTIVLPYTLENVGHNAFISCSLTTLYFSDYLSDISDESFKDCNSLKTIHINAYRDPVYVQTNRHSYYADKVDLLIESLKEDKPRMVFEGDSGIWFNLHGETIREAFPDYTVVNLGLNGFFNAQVQFGALSHYLRENDVFIHVPAPNSSYQFLINENMTESMYTSLELNYDLFAYVDISTMSDVFDSYKDYISAKMTLPADDYENISATRWIDESGCIPFLLPNLNGDEDLGDDAYVDKTIFTETSMSNLNDFYESVSSITKHQVLFGFGPTNYDGLSEHDRSEENLTSYETTVKSLFTSKVTFLDHMRDNVLRGHNFYNTDFHLNTIAGMEYTATLADHIQEALS